MLEMLFFVFVFRRQEEVKHTRCMKGHLFNEINADSLPPSSVFLETFAFQLQSFNEIE